MAKRLRQYTEHQKFIKVKNDHGSEDVYYSAFSDDLPDEMILKAQKDVNETEERKVEGIKKLNEFAKKNGLKPMEDFALLSFLRNCKYDIKKAEAKLLACMRVYEANIQFLTKYDVKLIESLIDEMAFCILPYRDKEGRVIVYSRAFPRMNCYDTELLDICYRAGAWYALSLPMASLLGVTCIMDNNIPTVRLYCTTMKFILRVVRYVFNVPLRIGRVQIINDGKFFQLGIKLIRPWLPTKLFERVTFLGSGLKNLPKFYHPSILPDDLGGTMGPLNDKLYKQHMWEKMLSELDRFRE